MHHISTQFRSLFGLEVSSGIKWSTAASVIINHCVFVTLKEKEKLYVELKQILARQPGPEAAEQLQQHKWLLRDKASKLKVIRQNITVQNDCPYISGFINWAKLKEKKTTVRFWYLQALTAQVRVLDHRMSEYRSENQRLADELTNVKKKYLSQKKLQRWCWSLCDIISAGQEDLCSPCVSSAKTGPVPGHRWTSWKLCPHSTTGPTLLEEASGLRILWGDDDWYNSTDLMSWLLVFFSDFDPGLNNKDDLCCQIWVVFFRPLASEKLCMDWMLLE